MKIAKRHPACEELRALCAVTRMVLALPVLGAGLGFGHALQSLILHVAPPARAEALTGPFASLLVFAAIAVLGLRAFLEIEHERRALSQTAALVTGAVAYHLALEGGNALLLALPVLLWGLRLHFHQLLAEAPAARRIPLATVSRPESWAA